MCTVEYFVIISFLHRTKPRCETWGRWSSRNLYEYDLEEWSVEGLICTDHSAQCTVGHVGRGRTSIVLPSPVGHLVRENSGPETSACRAFKTSLVRSALSVRARAAPEPKSHQRKLYVRVLISVMRALPSGRCRVVLVVR